MLTGFFYMWLGRETLLRGIAHVLATCIACLIMEPILGAVVRSKANFKPRRERREFWSDETREVSKPSPTSPVLGELETTLYGVITPWSTLRVISRTKRIEDVYLAA